MSPEATPTRTNPSPAAGRWVPMKYAPSDAAVNMPPTSTAGTQWPMSASQVGIGRRDVRRPPT